MRTFLLLLFCAFIITSAKTFSQEGHPIDVFLDSCMEKDYSTQGMVSCIEKAMVLWDKELNFYYKLLMDVLDEASAKTLKSAEIEWINFKEKEFTSIEMIYSKKEGTMYIPMKYFDKLEIIKSRALQLNNYYNLLMDID